MRNPGYVLLSHIAHRHYDENLRVKKIKITRDSHPWEREQEQWCQIFFVCLLL